MKECVAVARGGSRPTSLLTFSRNSFSSLAQCPPAMTPPPSTGRLLPLRSLRACTTTDRGRHVTQFYQQGRNLGKPSGCNGLGRARARVRDGGY